LRLPGFQAWSKGIPSLDASMPRILESKRSAAEAEPINKNIRGELKKTSEFGPTMAKVTGGGDPGVDLEIED